MPVIQIQDIVVKEKQNKTKQKTQKLKKKKMLESGKGCGTGMWNREYGVRGDHSILYRVAERPLLRSDN